MTAFDLQAMNERIAERWRIANRYPAVPVMPPPWAAKVVDAGDELIAVHADTGAPYTLNMHADLTPEDRAVVVGRRLLAAGASAVEVIRFFEAFELPPYVRERLVRDIRAVTR